jgi:hypothetical protein
MHAPLPSERFLELGFPAVVSVATLLSIAHLFGSSKTRCGIYLLAFSDQTFYIGQAVDVVRRFAQHRKKYSDINGFSFVPTLRANLNEIERHLIHRAELAGLLLLNAIHVSNIVGDTDFDLVVSPSEQALWIDSPVQTNENDASTHLTLPVSQIERFARQFSNYEQHRHFGRSMGILRIYLFHCVPFPKRTEYSFWTVSCLPSTNRDTWPRLLCVSAGVMELLVLGYRIDAAEEMWGFVTVASDVLSETFATEAEILAHFPTIEIDRRGYRDAGQHQITLFANNLRLLEAILSCTTVQRAAACLTLRVMRKRATIYSKFHCKQLAEGALP